MIHLNNFKNQVVSNDYTNVLKEVQKKFKLIYKSDI